MAPGLLTVGPFMGKVTGPGLLIESCNVTAERVAVVFPLLVNHKLRTVAFAWFVSYPIV